MTEPLQPDRRCRALTRAGKRCAKWAVVGRSTCESHSTVALEVVVPATGNGKANQAKGAGRDAAVAVLAEVVGSQSLDPTEVMREAVEMSRDLARKVGAMAERMDADDTDTAKDLVSLLRLYRETLTTLADVCKKDLDAGVARRRVQLDEAKARAALVAIDRALEVAVPESMRQRVRVEIGRQLQLAGT